MTFVGVCGGRDFVDRDFVVSVMEKHVKKDDVVVTGKCETGADMLAREWAKSSGRQVIDVPALWNWRRPLSVDRSAGPRRNAVIAALPLRLLIAFPGDVGTSDMVNKASANGIEVLPVKP